MTVHDKAHLATHPQRPVMMSDTLLGADDALFRLDAGGGGDCIIK